MQLVVSQLVFASSTRGTTEILHDRRKVMVMLLILMQVHDMFHTCEGKCYLEVICECTQVMREFCAEGAKKMGWHKLATVGKCFAKTEEEVTCNMQAELFEAIWCISLGCPFPNANLLD